MCEYIEMILVVEVGEVILVVVVFVEIEIEGVDWVAVLVLVSIVVDYFVFLRVVVRSFLFSS